MKYHCEKHKITNTGLAPSSLFIDHSKVFFSVADLLRLCVCGLKCNLAFVLSIFVPHFFFGASVGLCVLTVAFKVIFT